MLNEFNEGGTHSQNPLGGIPMGQDQNGNMNTVEEGETMKDNFVFSDRIVLTPEIVSQFNLPKSLANKTVADATKVINKKFEDRTGKIDESTKKSFLDRIGQAQESIKQIEQAELNAKMETNSVEVPDMLNGKIPEGMEDFTQNQMFDGGQMLGQHTGINQFMTGMDLANTAFGKSGIDTSGAIDINPSQIKPGMMGLDGAMKGIQAGAMFGPLGAGIGGAVGLTAGLIGGNKAKKDALKAHQNFQIGESNSLISNFSKGGKMYVNGGPLDINGNPIKNYSTQFDDPNYQPTGPEGFFKTPAVGAPYATPGFNPTINNKILPTVNNQNTSDFFPKENEISIPNQPSRTFGPQSTGHTGYQNYRNIKSKVGDFLNNTGSTINENIGNVMRYAPVAMNALQLRNLNKKGYDTVNPIINNDRYNPQYMDEKSLTNQINAEFNYTANALANATNGSLGALSNNILGSQLNKTKALSDAYSKIADVNRNENRVSQQFNTGITEANIARRVNAEDKTAMNKGAFNTEKSKLMGQIGDDLGNIGKEQVYKKLAKEAFNYTWDGKYVKDNKGQILIDPETKQPMTQEKYEQVTGKKK